MERQLLAAKEKYWLQILFNSKEIDYQSYLIDYPPDLTDIRRGPEAGEKRREAALKRMLQDKQSEDQDTQ